MIIDYPEIGACGLSCRLCPMYHTRTKSRCFGCKTEARMTVGCPFITCAIKKKGLEFCWKCEEAEHCEKWKKHREAGKRFDSFKCYQKLEDNIAFIQIHGVESFQSLQKTREELLKSMLANFNEGRSKSYFCIAATVLEIEELEEALNEAKEQSLALGIKEKSKVLHSLLDEIAERKHLLLKLRK